MTNADLNLIHGQIFGVLGTVSLLPEPIDLCEAMQLVLAWLDYVNASGTEREVVLRYKSVGVNYALQKIICKGYPGSQELEGFWACLCNLPGTQFNQGNNVFPTVRTPFIGEDYTSERDSNHAVTVDPALPYKQISSLWVTGDDDNG